MSGGPDDQHRVRAAKNQSLFREANERIEQLSSDEERVECVCECVDLDCVEKILMTVEEYERVRAAPNSFAIKYGHDDPSVETVTLHADHYVVVQKIGAGAAVAARLDPRSHGK
jgi:hypothetical protein